MEGHFLACTCGPDIVYFAFYEDFPTASHGSAKQCSTVLEDTDAQPYPTPGWGPDLNFGNWTWGEHLIYSLAPCMWNFLNAKNVNFSLSNQIAVTYQNPD